jgi:hypothetical protein
MERVEGIEWASRPDRTTYMLSCGLTMGAMVHDHTHSPLILRKHTRYYKERETSAGCGVDTDSRDHLFKNARHDP